MTKTGNLTVNCRDCSTCRRLFSKFGETEILAKHKNQLTREIIEAAAINKQEDDGVSTPSVALLDKELSFISTLK